MEDGDIIEWKGKCGMLQATVHGSLAVLPDGHAFSLGDVRFSQSFNIVRNEMDRH